MRGRLRPLAPIAHARPMRLRWSKWPGRWHGGTRGVWRLLNVHRAHLRGIRLIRHLIDAAVEPDADEEGDTHRKKRKNRQGNDRERGAQGVLLQGGGDRLWAQRKDTSPVIERK